MTDLTIRRLTEADVEAFREIRLEALRTNPESFGNDLATESGRPLEWFTGTLATSTVVGALDGDKLVGIAALLVHPGAKRAHKGMLWGMYVRRAWREAGVARRLAGAILEAARGRVEIVQLSVTRTNQAARRLYAGLGFREYGLEKDALKVGDRYFDDILMALDLRPD